MSVELREISFSVSVEEEERISRLKSTRYNEVSWENMIREILLRGLEIAEMKQTNNKKEQ